MLKSYQHLKGQEVLPNSPQGDALQRTIQSLQRKLQHLALRPAERIAGLKTKRVPGLVRQRSGLRPLF